MVKKCYLNKKKRRERTTREGDAGKVVFGRIEEKRENKYTKIDNSTINAIWYRSMDWMAHPQWTDQNDDGKIVWYVIPGKMRHMLHFLFFNSYIHIYATCTREAHRTFCIFSFSGSIGKYRQRLLTSSKRL